MPGYKIFTQDETLESDDVNDYLMLQAVMVFENEIERNASLLERLRPGITAYVKNLNELSVYDGSSWRRIPTYDELAAINAEAELKKLIVMDVDDPIVLYVEDYFLHDGCADLWCAWGFW